MVSMKLMAPVFTAYDHSTYTKLIARHLANVLSLPAAVLAAFKEGCFVVSITGKAWHSVGIDEAHEMGIRIVKHVLFDPLKTTSIELQIIFRAEVNAWKSAAANFSRGQNKG